MYHLQRKWVEASTLLLLVVSLLARIVVVRWGLENSITVLSPAFQVLEAGVVVMAPPPDLWVSVMTISLSSVLVVIS
jgi:hypothetical protein